MHAFINEHKTTKKYKYINLLIADNVLFDYDLVKKWNNGIDCHKAGSVVSVILRQKIG